MKLVVNSKITGRESIFSFRDSSVMGVNLTWDVGIRTLQIMLEAGATIEIPQCVNDEGSPNPRDAKTFTMDNREFTNLETLHKMMGTKLMLH